MPSRSEYYEVFFIVEEPHFFDRGFRFVDECLTETRDSLEKRRAVLSLQVITETEEDLKQDLEQQIQLEKRKRVAEHAEEVKVRGNMLPTRAGKKRTVDFSDEDEDDDSEGSHSSAVVKRGRGRGRGRAKPAATTTRGHGRGRGRGAKALNAKSRKHAESEEESVIVSDSEVEEVVNPPRTAAPKRVSASNSRSSIATTNKTEASSSRKEAKLKFGKLLVRLSFVIIVIHGRDVLTACCLLCSPTKRTALSPLSTHSMSTRRQ